MKIDDELRHAADLARECKEWPARPGDADLMDRAADRIHALETRLYDMALATGALCALVPRWTPFSQQEPPPDEQVLVFGGDYRYRVIAHSPSVLNPWTHREGIDPTHWCPLPPDPGDAEDGGNKVVEVSP